MNKTENKNKFPLHGWIGILLVIVFWYLNWNLPGLRTDWAFFPLWLGFCLTVDGIVFLRKGTSLLKRSLKKYIMLFIISAPVWWLFEIFNSITQNWFYEGKEYYSDLQFFILASISFSIVIPAVFECAELTGTFKWVRNLKSGWVLKPTRKLILLLWFFGLITLVLEIIFPDIFYPLIWITVYFIIEPINIKMNNVSLTSYTSEGNWKPVISLGIGCLICAFFWEMWNYYSYPKWYYYLPMVNFLHIFEMPLLGYVGYLPFSIELFAVYNFIMGIFGDKNSNFVKLNGELTNSQIEFTNLPAGQAGSLIRKSENS